jgi:signal transduction histidine kinase
MLSEAKNRAQIIGKNQIIKEIQGRSYYKLVTSVDQTATFTCYLVAIDYNGVILAHPTNSNLIGKNVSSLKDAKQDYLVKKFMDAAKTKPTGAFVDYWWTKVGATDPILTSAYVSDVDGTWFLVVSRDV